MYRTYRPKYQHSDKSDSVPFPDYREIESTLKDLKEHQDQQISTLSGRTLNQYKYIVKLVKTYENTKYYPSIYKKFTDIFSDVNNVKPGTIGAYIVGCLLSNNICSPICAGSAPLPDSKPCDSNVIWGYYDGNRYNFVTINISNTSDNNGKVLVFINSTSPNGFPGFSDDEKSELIRMGYVHIKIIGYSQDGSELVVIIPEWTSIDKVKSRVTINPVDPVVRSKSIKVKGNDTNGNNTIYIVLVIIVVFIILTMLMRIR
jgi:hypothetical protein